MEEIVDVSFCILIFRIEEEFLFRVWNFVALSEEFRLFWDLCFVGEGGGGSLGL